MRRQGLWLASLAALGACASLEDIRASEPVAAETFAAEYRALAECVHFKVGGDLRVNAVARTALLGTRTDWLSAPLPDYELRLSQQSDAKVLVELRQRWTLSKDWLRERVWGAVEGCHRQLAHGSAPAQR